jgi:hypothetical protein
MRRRLFIGVCSGWLLLATLIGVSCVGCSSTPPSNNPRLRSYDVRTLARYASRFGYQGDGTYVGVEAGRVILSEEGEGGRLFVFSDSDSPLVRPLPGRGYFDEFFVNAAGEMVVWREWEATREFFNAKGHPLARLESDNAGRYFCIVRGSHVSVRAVGEPHSALFEFDTTSAAFSPQWIFSRGNVIYLVDGARAKDQYKCWAYGPTSGGYSRIKEFTFPGLPNDPDPGSPDWLIQTYSRTPWPSPNESLLYNEEKNSTVSLGRNSFVLKCFLEKDYLGPRLSAAGQ